MKNLVKLLGVTSVIASVIVNGVTISSNRQLKYENKKLNINVTALNDSVRISKNKINELEFNRKTFITDRIQELEKLSKDLASEVKNTKGKLVALQSSKIKIKTKDTLPIQIVTVTDTVPGAPSGFTAIVNLDTTYSPGNYRKLSHELRFYSNDTSSTLTEELGIKLITGLKKNKKNDYEILFRSNFPNLTVTELQGAYIPRNQLKNDFKKKRITLGAHIGYSPTAYDLTERRFKFRNQITGSIGINYQFF